jgi:hypothetical protein
MPDPNPCRVLSCFLANHAIAQCHIERCCYRWQREARR